MIEFKKIDDPDARRDSHEIYLNGELLQHVDCGVSEEKGSFSLVTRFRPSIDKIINLSLRDFSLKIDYLYLLYDQYIDSLDSISIGQAYDIVEEGRSRRFIYKEDQYSISFEFSNIVNWKRPYTIVDYHYWLTKVIEKSQNPLIRVQLRDSSEGLRHGFAIEFPYLSPDTQIAQEIETHLQEISNFDKIAESFIFQQQNANSVILNLDIPEDIRIPYEQYLVYFSKFLEDLGVDVSSQLHHEASNILFMVTPKDEKEALEKIRVALEIYLRLPNSPVNGYSDVKTGVDIQRLTSNVQHLQSQLSLARAEKQLQEALVEAKDVAIQALKFTITEQRKLLSENVSGDIIDISADSKKDKEKEEILDGLISLTKYEGKGFEVNIPEIFRRLREIFKK